VFAPTNSTWTTTSTLNDPRQYHTATLLPNGKVLVAGGLGTGVSNVLATAELFNYTAGTWARTGAMKTNRYQHTSALLGNGTVLVMGGLNAAGNTLKTVEYYKPNLGSWKSTGAMNYFHLHGTATLLANGKVLLTGGTDGTNNAVAQSELYDPVAGTWATTGSLATARWNQTATLLPSGRVLVMGGRNSSNVALSTVELFDPNSGTWTNTGAMATARQTFTATLLNNGEVLAAGGINLAGTSTNAAELYDTISGKWATCTNLNIARAGHTATFLTNGQVLLTSGLNATTNVSQSAELFNTGLLFTNTWQPQITSFSASPLLVSNGIVINGSQFRGPSYGTGSASAGQDSPANYPIAQLRGVEGGIPMFLTSTNWATNNFTSLPLNNYPSGYAMVTLFANGIPANSFMLSISNIVIPEPFPFSILSYATLGNGSFQINFTNTPGIAFVALGSSDPTLAVTNWSVLGSVSEISAGQFQFVDSQASTISTRFYTVKSQ
jgi:hypothetical protein